MVKINNIICLLAVSSLSLVAGMPAESDLNKRDILEDIDFSGRIFGKNPKRWGCCEYDCNQEKWPASDACRKARYNYQIGRPPIDACHYCDF